MTPVRLRHLRLDRNQLVGLAGSIGSAITIVAGVIWLTVVAIPIGAILLTAFTAYVIQHQMQENARKYEKRKLAV